MFDSAARRISAREVHNTHGARDERALLVRFHTQTAGVSLTAQQPPNDVVRTVPAPSSAVVGGASRRTPAPPAPARGVLVGSRRRLGGGGAAARVGRRQAPA